MDSKNGGASADLLYVPLRKGKKPEPKSGVDQLDLDVLS
jgi:hypothetical protein